MKRTRAFTLIEMLMTMTMGSSLMLLAIGLVHQSLSLSKLGKVRGEHDLTVSRLAQQFRADVHSAATVKAASADSLQLEMPDGTAITYSVKDATLQRFRTTIEGVNGYEQFRFEPLCRVQFRSQTADEVVLLQLERRNVDQQVPPRVELQVASRVGRWRELESPHVSPQPGVGAHP